MFSSDSIDYPEQSTSFSYMATHTNLGIGIPALSECVSVQNISVEDIT